jgi:putative tributyrin esterase
MAKFTCNFISYTLLRAVDITVVVPSPTTPEAMGMGLEPGSKPSHKPKAKYPVLYLLHGMANNHATWTGYTNVEFYAEERNIAVVMISGENKSYVNHPSGDRFFDFLSKEVPEFVCGMFPISDRPEDTYIAGLSMGGYGTLVHALNNPERFAALGAFSAAVSLNPAALANIGDTKAEDTNEVAESVTSGKINPQYDPSSLAESIYKEGRKFPKIYLACGAKDFLYNANQEFRDKLTEYGADVTWFETPNHGHEWRFWDLVVEKFLDWIPRTDEYAKGGAKRQI